MGTANQFAFGSCAFKIGCDGAVPPSGQQNGSKPTALRMIGEGAERIARSLWTPVLPRCRTAEGHGCSRFARPGVISAGWMGVLSGPRQRPIWRNRDPDHFPPVVRVFSLRGNAGRTPALHGPSRMGLVSEAGAHPTARPRRNQKPPGSCFFLGPESSPVRLKFKAWDRSGYRVRLSGQLKISPSLSHQKC